MIFELVYYGFNRLWKLQWQQHEDPVTALGWYEKESRQHPDVLCLRLVHPRCLQKRLLQTTKDRGQLFRYTETDILKQCGRLCAMFGQLISWTASPWENQAQEIHRMKETKIAHTVNVRNRRKYSQCQEKMSQCELSCFHPDERAPSTYNYCTWL